MTFADALAGLFVLVIILVVFGVVATITAVFERLPRFPPDYTDDPLPPPNPRTVVRRHWNVPH